MQKVCTKCKEEKTLDFFPKSGKWYRNKCKKCTSDERCVERSLKSEQNKLYQKEYRKKNKSVLSDKDKIRKKLHKVEVAQRSKYYYENNKEQIIKKNYEYEKKRKQEDLSYKLLKNLRKRLRDCLYQKIDTEQTKDLIGCTQLHFKSWLNYQLDINMNWNNYGSYWVLDHVKPCASFDLSNNVERLECFNWKNIRPLEKIKNSEKQSKYNKTIKFLHEIILKSFKIKQNG